MPALSSPTSEHPRPIYVVNARCQTTRLTPADNPLGGLEQPSRIDLGSGYLVDTNQMCGTPKPCSAAASHHADDFPGLLFEGIEDIHVVYRRYLVPSIASTNCLSRRSSRNRGRRGMAWVFVKCVAANSPLYNFEAAAKSNRLGLWADAHPIPPWDWRTTKRINEVGKAWRAAQIQRTSCVSC